MTKKAAIFSFFSGAGFLDLGFESYDFDVSFVNELHKPFMDAYKYSRHIFTKKTPKFGYYTMDMKAFLHNELFGQMVKNARESSGLVGFVGGPPCPDFSVAGKNKGSTGENGRLSESYIQLICQHSPDFFLFENVKGLYRTQKHREFFEQMKDTLRASGYQLEEKLINAIEYGAPQDRSRIILIGFRSGFCRQFEWLGQKFSAADIFKREWPTKNSFSENSAQRPPSKLPLELTVQHWFDKNKVTKHPNAKHHFNPRAINRFLQINEGDTDKKSYKRLHRWRYSPTVAYGNNEVHLHPYKVRRISAAEALSLQSLPIEFQLPPDMTLSNMFKTIGNGVPFLAAKGLAHSIQKHIERV